jgi:hypothetical protein
VVLEVENIEKNQGNRASSYRGGIIGTLHTGCGFTGVPLIQGNQGDEGNQEDFKKEKVPFNIIHSS